MHSIMGQVSIAHLKATNLWCMLLQVGSVDLMSWYKGRHFDLKENKHQIICSRSIVNDVILRY